MVKMIKTKLLFLLALFCSLSTYSQTVPDEIVDLFDEVSSVADPEEDVNYLNHVISVRINKSIIQRDYAKYVVRIICDDSYFEPSYWQDIDFKICLLYTSDAADEL